MLSKLLREYKVSKETSDSMVKKKTEEWWIKHVCEVHTNKCRDENIIRIVVEEMVEEVIKTHQVGGIVDEYIDDVLEDSDSDTFDEPVVEEIMIEEVNETRDSWLGIPFRSFQHVGRLMLNRVRSTMSPPNTVVIIGRNCEDREEYFPK
jgi:hypothetical protein